MAIDELGPVEDDDPLEPRPEPEIDFEDDPVALRSEQELEDMADDQPGDGARSIDNADLDNVLDELVDMMNGRDLDAMGDLFAEGVESGFLVAASRDELIEGFNDLFLRNPSLLATRADLGPEPIVVLWVFDHEADRFDPFGYMAVELDETDVGSIVNVDFVDELPESDDLVVEYPERSDLPEWEEWSELDED